MTTTIQRRTWQSTRKDFEIKRAVASHEPVRIKYGPLEQYVRVNIQGGRSPERIYGRLLLDYPDELTYAHKP